MAFPAVRSGRTIATIPNKSFCLMTSNATTSDFGFMLDSTGQRVPRPEEFAIVERMASLAVNGLTVEDIADATQDWDELLHLATPRHGWNARSVRMVLESYQRHVAADRGVAEDGDAEPMHDDDDDGDDDGDSDDSDLSSTSDGSEYQQETDEGEIAEDDTDEEVDEQNLIVDELFSQLRARLVSRDDVVAVRAMCTELLELLREAGARDGRDYERRRCRALGQQLLRYMDI
eukprot:ANDGO_01347.mRNA.1 hypothetical protein